MINRYFSDKGSVKDKDRIEFGINIWCKTENGNKWNWNLDGFIACQWYNFRNSLIWNGIKDFANKTIQAIWNQQKVRIISYWFIFFLLEIYDV